MHLNSEMAGGAGLEEAEISPQPFPFDCDHSPWGKATGLKVAPAMWLPHKECLLFQISTRLSCNLLIPMSEL